MRCENICFKLTVTASVKAKGLDRVPQPVLLAI